MADIDRYYDPYYTGGGSDGTASAPWTEITSAVWNTLDSDAASLTGSDVVTLWMNAVKSDGTTTAETTSGLADIQRADASTTRIILDGQTYYNDNHATPNWVAYSGDKQHEINRNAQPWRFWYTDACDYVSLVGMKLWVWNGGKAVMTRNGSNNILLNLTVDVDPAATTPDNAFYFEHHTRANANTWDNVTVDSCTVINTRGECIYVGGNEDLSGSGNNGPIAIINNSFSNPATRGNPNGEGDGIDIKDNVLGVTIRGNTVFYDDDEKSEPDNRDGINLASFDTDSVCEDNFIYNFARTGIAGSVWWNNQGTAPRTGGKLRNNLIVNCATNTGLSNRGGIFFEGGTGQVTGGSNDQFEDIEIDFNTIWNCGGNHIHIASECVNFTVRNNIMSENPESEPTLSSDRGWLLFAGSAGALGTHSNNLFYRAGGGTPKIVTDNGTQYTSATVTTWEATAVYGDPKFVDTTDTTDPTGWYLQSDSPAIEAGTTVSGILDDKIGTVRDVSTPDIGCHEYVSGETGPTGGKSSLMRLAG